MLRTRTWVILVSAAALILAALSWYLLGTRRDSRIVEILQDGKLLRSIDLAAVTEEYSFEVEWPGGGSNTIRVQPGRVCVSDADCPDRVCVSQGWLSDQPTPIVCLPHRLVIRVAGETAADAAAR
ncbi:MAG: NusG domain II-containing protein [Oscillospiraceae bacterium]|nr:NusG domain II-containing protein [Oscillospiraceae bacterium]